MEQAPRLITPNGFYYLLAESLEGDLRKALDNRSEVKGLFIVYVTNQNDIKYTVSTLVFGKLIGEQFNIHMQTTSISPQEWQ
ncbi:MAG: hypothetical protein KGN31_04440 [Betaproteobacteria bacterium]|nr:hypothetical protein [Betaproteobacteria bacterium]